jgi:acyl transferase domain-containing protein
MAAVGRLWQADVPIDWAALHEGNDPRRTPLPTYPFERQQFRLGAVATTAPQQPVEHAVPGSAEAGPSPASTEQAVAAAFGAALGIESVGVQENFFDLGGDSLVAVRVVALIRRSLGELPDLGVRMFFRAPTAAQLAHLIEDSTIAEGS